MYAGAASGAVTIGLALFLIMMSQKPNASETQTQPPPETAVAEQTVAKKKLTETLPSQMAVVLPPPPAAALPETPEVAEAPPVSPPASEPAPRRTQRPPLKPRAIDAPAETADIKPLKPRPQPRPPPEPQSVPKSVPKPALGPEKISPEQVARLPDATSISSAAAQSKPAAVTATVTATVTRKTVKEGRALLKMLEIGKGPMIEIAWPQKSADRSRLYRLLTSCHGMQTAMLADGRRLYTAAAAPGQTWNVNRDAVSGFIRKPSGALTDAERAVIHRIKTRHSIGAGDTVRLFPRGVDAVMLGGLGQIVGPGYLKYRTIRARYQLTGDRVSVVDIRMDGETRSGGVTLPRTQRCN